MKCNNIYIVDNYIYFKDKEISFKKSILNNGIITNKKEFIKQISPYFSYFSFNKNIKIIYSDLLSINDISLIDNIFIDLNFKKIELIKDKSLIKLSKINQYLINNELIRYYYVDKYNVKKTLILDKNSLSSKEITYLLKQRINNNNNIYVINETPDIIKILEDLNVNYYVYNINYFLDFL